MEQTDRSQGGGEWRGPEEVGQRTYMHTGIGHGHTQQSGEGMGVGVWMERGNGGGIGGHLQ